MRKQMSHNGRTHHILEVLRPNNAEENFASHKSQPQVISRAQEYRAHDVTTTRKDARTREIARD